MKRPFLLPVLLCLAPVGLGAQESSSEPERRVPDMPRVWDDAAMERLELPLPSRRHSPRHMPADYYYAVPERTIYKDYPVYHPDREPDERAGPGLPGFVRRELYRYLDCGILANG